MARLQGRDWIFEKMELAVSGEIEAEADKKKSTSRKWIVTVWAMFVGTLVVVFEGVCAFMGREAPQGFAGLATLLFSTGIAYIGGNVLQKKIYSDGPQREE